MSNIRRRLEALEGPTNSHKFAGWPVEEQVKDAVYMLQFYQRFHANDPVRYAATDRELTMLAIAHASEELQGEGEVGLPHSGTTIRYLRDGEDTFSIDVDGVVAVEDLPEGVREYFKRMNPKEQPARDQWLYEMWRDEFDRGEGGSYGTLRSYQSRWSEVQGGRYARCRVVLLPQPRTGRAAKAQRFEGRTLRRSGPWLRGDHVHQGAARGDGRYGPLRGRLDRSLRHRQPTLEHPAPGYRA